MNLKNTRKKNEKNSNRKCEFKEDTLESGLSMQNGSSLCKSFKEDDLFLNEQLIKTFIEYLLGVNTLTQNCLIKMLIMQGSFLKELLTYCQKYKKCG